jgi:hypothetical protein
VRIHGHDWIRSVTAAVSNALLPVELPAVLDALRFESAVPKHARHGICGGTRGGTHLFPPLAGCGKRHASGKISGMV